MAKIKTTRSEVTYYLELNQEEAEALAAVLARVAGDPSKTARGAIQNILGALIQGGISYSATQAWKTVSGRIWFGQEYDYNYDYDASEND